MRPFIVSAKGGKKELRERERERERRTGMVGKENEQGNRKQISVWKRYKSKWYNSQTKEEKPNWSNCNNWIQEQKEKERESAFQCTCFSSEQRRGAYKISAEHKSLCHYHHYTLLHCKRKLWTMFSVHLYSHFWVILHIFFNHPFALPKD